MIRAAGDGRQAVARMVRAQARSRWSACDAVWSAQSPCAAGVPTLRAEYQMGPGPGDRFQSVASERGSVSRARNLPASQERLERIEG